MDEEEEKLFFKEVALLNSLMHHCVVKFKAVCYQLPAMMLEYVCFDFNLLRQDIRVNTLSDFLCHAATELINGLAKSTVLQLGVS